MHFLFSDVSVSLDEKLVSSPTSLYPYRAYIETLLSCQRISINGSHVVQGYTGTGRTRLDFVVIWFSDWRDSVNISLDKINPSVVFPWSVQTCFRPSMLSWTWILCYRLYARNQNWIYLKFHLHIPVWHMGIGSRKNWRQCFPGRESFVIGCYLILMYRCILVPHDSR
jgi:hypothetical protein